MKDSEVQEPESQARKYSVVRKRILKERRRHFGITSDLLGFCMAVL